MNRAVKHIILFPLLAVGLFLSSCATTCYNERFCRELVGLSGDQVISILGVPTNTVEQGKTKVMEWAYDGTYQTNWVVPGRADTWVDSRGGTHSTFVPPYERVETIPQVAVLRLTLTGNRVTSYTSQFHGSGMCNHFIPADYISRYEAEDNAKRD